MKTYKMINYAVKEFVVQIKGNTTSNSGSFACMLDGEPFTVNYQRDQNTNLFVFDLHLGNEHYLISNSSTNYKEEYLINYKNLEVLFDSGSRTMYVKADNQSYLPINVSYKPTYNYIKFCTFFRNYYYYNF